VKKEGQAASKYLRPERQNDSIIVVMSLTTRPFAHLTELDDLASQDQHNIAKGERVASMVAGCLLATPVFFRRSSLNLFMGLLGGALIYRSARGQCAVYGKLGINTARLHPERGVPGNKGINVEVTTHIQRPAQDLFNYWRHLENLPRFMPHLINVEETTDRLSHWTVRGPFNRSLEWDAEIIEEHPGKMISWQTLPGAVVSSAGSVWFEPEAGSTRVKISLKYEPPAGSTGALIASILRLSPETQIKEDLARFKSIMETTQAETAGETV